MKPKKPKPIPLDERARTALFKTKIQDGTIGIVTVDMLEQTSKESFALAEYFRRKDLALYRHLTWCAKYLGEAGYLIELMAKAHLRGKRKAARK
jgi:hypothetical protein